MTFYEARHMSQIGALWVRREAWAAGKWVVMWRGLWWQSIAGARQVVLATEYSAADLLANDWSTMPATLAACTVNPDTGSTGGSTGRPGTGGFRPRQPGLGGGGGSTTPPIPPPVPPTPPSIPPPTDVGTIVLTLQGIVLTQGAEADVFSTHPDGRYTVPKVSNSTWQKKFPKGQVLSVGVTFKVFYEVTVQREDDLFTVTVAYLTEHENGAEVGSSTGACFASEAPQARFGNILNSITPGTVTWGGGQAKVS